MLDIPFALETIPANDADNALARLTRDQIDAVPVLLGDADIFSAEWAETVDTFEPPEEVLAQALALDTEAWFANHTVSPQLSEAGKGFLGRLYHAAASPFGTRSLAIGTDTAAEAAHAIAALNSQLADLEASGQGTAEEFADIRQIIDAAEQDGTNIFPDPVAYVTPRRGDRLAAGLVKVREPWEAAAWLQHGTYALCAPKPVLVGLCKWLWEQHGGRIITASTDHIGFQMERPIASLEEAEVVLRRFSALGADAINADHRGSSGVSLVDAERLWVWWD